MNALARLQVQMRAALLGHRGVLARHIAVPEGISAQARLDVYTDGYLARMEEVLQAEYPALLLQLGPTDFGWLAAAYCAKHRSRHPDLRHFGASLPGFLRAHGAAFGPPWMADLAMLERACSVAFDAADLPLLDPRSLARLVADSGDDVSLCLHPSARLLSLGGNVAAVHQQASRDVRLPARSGAAAFWLVWRQNARIRQRRLDLVEARLLRRLTRGLSTAALLRALCRTYGDPAAAMAAFGQLMDGWIRAGLLCHSPAQAS